MKTATRPITDLSQDPANARTHDERNLATITASLRRFGQQKPIVVDTSGVVRAGNGTLAAAKALGWDSVEVVETDLQGSEATAYAIADNRTAELAGWDDEVLAATLGAIAADDPDLLAAAGYDEKELEQLMAETFGEVVEDDVPEPPADPITKPGDLWALGEHRVLCGDSTKAEDVERVMGGAVADLVVADPPYGMNLDTDYSKLPSTKAEGNKNYEPVFGDDADFDYREIKLPQHSEGFWFGADYYARTLPQGGSWIVWDKRVEEQFDKMFGSAFELIWSIARHKREIIRHNCTLFSGNNEARGRVHPTTKPTAVIAWIIKRYGGRGIILDPFLGSGTTLIAAEQLNRKCYGLEISPAYCDVIIQRWENLTEQKAKLL
jgi:DNA modification methylase